MFRICTQAAILQLEEPNLADWTLGFQLVLVTFFFFFFLKKLENSFGEKKFSKIANNLPSLNTNISPFASLYDNEICVPVEKPLDSVGIFSMPNLE